MCESIQLEVSVYFFFSLFSHFLLFDSTNSNRLGNLDELPANDPDDPIEYAADNDDGRVAEVQRNIEKCAGESQCKKNKNKLFKY